MWILDLTRDLWTRLTFGPEDERFPTWSADGQHVAFGVAEDGVARTGADGSGPVESLDPTPERFPVWFTADGDLIYMGRDDSGGPDIGLLPLCDPGKDTVLLESEFIERNATVSPDGRWLAYGSNETGRFEVYVRPFPEVGAFRRQISTLGGRWPVWNPSGNELFFLGDAGVVAVPYDDTPTFTPGAPVTLFDWPQPTVTQGNRRMAVSPDGQRFLLLRDRVAATADDDNPAQVIVVENWFEELKRLAPTP